MTVEKVNELTVALIEGNTNWAFDDAQASRDFAQFVDGILTMASTVKREIEKERGVTE